MRIFEIIKSNKTLLKLLGIDIKDYIGRGPMLVEVLNMSIKNQSPQRNRIWLPIIEEFDQNATQVLDQGFSPDKDLEKKLTQLKSILNTIQSLKSQLKL